MDLLTRCILPGLGSRVRCGFLLSVLLIDCAIRSAIVSVLRRWYGTSASPSPGVVRGAASTFCASVWSGCGTTALRHGRDA